MELKPPYKIDHLPIKELPMQIIISPLKEKYKPTGRPTREFSALKEDIKKNGLKVPILVRRVGDKERQFFKIKAGFISIIDGGHRFTACEELGKNVIRCRMMDRDYWHKINNHLDLSKF
ncbi:ParB-like nuclease domain-containing protein [candidate division WOR-3 bacterium]|nr:ParB-like nuclease domain-containing protein [candidate division WOR-3 bacterium]